MPSQCIESQKTEYLCYNYCNTLLVFTETCLLSYTQHVNRLSYISTPLTINSFYLRVLGDNVTASQKKTKWRSVRRLQCSLVLIRFLSVVLLSNKTYKNKLFLFCYFLLNGPPESDSFFCLLVIEPNHSQVVNFLSHELD